MDRIRPRLDRPPECEHRGSAGEHRYRRRPAGAEPIGEVAAGGGRGDLADAIRRQGNARVGGGVAMSPQAQHEERDDESAGPIEEGTGGEDPDRPGHRA